MPTGKFRIETNVLDKTDLLAEFSRIAEQKRNEPSLIVVAGLDVGRIYPCTQAEMVIGRDEDVALHIDDGSISRRHAKVYFRNNVLYLRDLDSTNGTFCNGERIYETPLSDGDKIVIGKTAFIKLSLPGELDKAFKEDIFKVFTEDSPLAIAIFDEQGWFKYSNPKFEHIFGYNRHDFSSFEDWHKQCFAGTSEAEFESFITTSGQIKEHESLPSNPIEILDAQGASKRIQILGVQLKTKDKVILCQDLTEQYSLELQLQHVQRMKAIGTLAGGIAHDFNNLLMAIQGNISLLAMDASEDSDQYELIKNIEQYIKAGANLTKQLLGFARGGKYEVKTVSINDIVEKTSTLFGRTKKNIVFQLDLQQDVFHIDADKTQIEQVLINLYVNAWQAMPKGGTIKLATVNAEVSKEQASLLHLEAGEYVHLTVKDSGQGISEDIMPHIFEPFFTTKDQTISSGLGLASAYGIIKNHNGSISCGSESGRGSTFHIYLPKVTKELSPQMSPAKEIELGQGTVLLVDDEKMITKVGKKMLERMGYKALVAHDGKQALQILQEHEEDISLVILDMIMPNMGGDEVFDEIHKRKPTLKVLLSSGYAMDEEIKGVLDKGAAGFIQKPFDLSALSVKLRELLDGSANR